MSVWSNEAVTGFISQYKSHPCLWKVKHVDYKSRRARYRAIEELVVFCRNVGFKSANADLVRKKIQSLRGAFRKELRKTMASQESGADEDNIHKPNLWYFDQLMFTKDQELNDEEEGEGEGVADNEEETSFSEQWDMKLESVDVPCPFNETSRSLEESTNIDPTPQTTPNSSLVNNQQPVSSNWANSERGKRKLPSDLPEYMNSGSNIALCISETEAVGINVAKKLQRMNRMQALYAETVINSVLRQGLMNKLTQDTDLCDNQCSKNFFG